MKPLSILWVEDQRNDNLTLIEAIEGDRRASLTCVDNVAQALAVLSHASFDLVIVDLNLPLGGASYVDGHRNGLHVIDFIEAHGIASRVLCLTNFVEDAATALRGRCTVLKKGIFVSDLCKVVFRDP